MLISDIFRDFLNKQLIVLLLLFLVDNQLLMAFYQANKIVFLRLFLSIFCDLLTKK